MRKGIRILCAAGIVIGVIGVPSAAAGGGCYPNPDIEMTSTTDPSVLIGECAFIDTVVYIEPGDEITWANKDPIPHTVSGAAGSWGSDEVLDRGETVSYTFEQDGVYPYYCALHPTMVGAVVVGDALTPAALTGGKADVGAANGAVAAAEPTSDRSADSNPTAIVLALVGALGLVALAIRTFGLRKRAEVAPTP